MKNSKYLLFLLMMLLNMFFCLSAYAGEEVNNIPDWLKRTDIYLRYDSDSKPQYAIETIQPIYQSTDKIYTYFYQARLNHRESIGTTSNLGFGYRKLMEDRKSLFGLNTFYDYAHKNDHSRWGLGLEYFTGNTEFRVNNYKGISGDREIASTVNSKTYEKVLSGYDYEIGASLVNAPWLSLYAKGFYYDYKHANDAKGYKLRANMQLTPSLAMEFGYWDDNKTSGEKYLSFAYTLTPSSKPALSESKKWNNLKQANLEDKLLQKVNRENEVRVEAHTVASLPVPPPAGSHTVTFSIHFQGSCPNVTPSLTAYPSAVGAPDILLDPHLVPGSDVGGNATYGPIVLPAGDYEIRTTGTYERSSMIFTIDSDDNNKMVTLIEN